ncbi:ABC transporter permease [Acidobacteriota bacterium]
MFDLEKEIRNWKKSFYKHEVLEDALIADIEIHLRETYESLRNTGLDKESAFLKATAEVGTAESIAAEYTKNRLVQLNRRSPLRLSRFMPSLVGSYIKIVIRKIKRQKGYSILNIAGLSIGLACCILMVLYIHSELSFDTFHENADRIYVLGVSSERDGYEFRSTSSNATAAAVLQKDYPEVAQAVRYGYKPESNFTYDGKHFSMDQVMYADKNVFDVFTWPIIEGDTSSALSAPHSIVITEEIANTCFGDEDPIGRVLEFSKNDSYVVTGVIKDVPENSEIQFNALCSFSTLYTQEGMDHLLTEWLPHVFNTYILLEEGIAPAELEQKFPALLEQYAGEEMRARGATESYFLHSLRRLYLSPPWTDRGPIFYVYIFSAVAILVLLIACFNFMNLSTARAATRAQEVGMRKVLGAHRSNLINQFFSESIFFSFISLVLAVLIVQLTLPAISSLTGRTIRLNVSDPPWMIPGFILLALFVGLAAGSYPALYLSRFMPIKVLRGKLDSVKSNLNLRRGLVVFQFVISITLVICTVIIVRQLFFLQNKEVGFDRDNVVVISARDSVIQDSLELVKEEFKQNPNVISVAASSTIPSWGYPNNQKIPEGHDISESVLMDEINADTDFLPTLGFELVAGRNFSKEYGGDKSSAVIINETAVRRFGWDQPLGKTIKSIDPSKPGNQFKDMTVIGVVKDFHQRSLIREIEPVFISYDPDYPLSFNFMDVISVRIRPEKTADTLEFMEGRWKEMFSDLPMNYGFLDEIFARQFRQIERSRQLFSYFTFLAIFVACLGLYGMASFSAIQRTKEIGIRKVLGSSIIGILKLLGKELIVLVCLANILAWPLSFFIMKQWIRNFPYSVDMSFMSFAGSSLIILIIGLLTVSHQAIKAALANPVDSLLYE